MATLTNSDFNYTGNPVTETGAAALTRHVYDDADNLVATLTAEAYNGVSQIDYAPVARQLYKDQQAASWTVGARGSKLATNPLFMQNIGYMDYNLQARVKIESTTYTFLRAVKQATGLDGLEMLKNYKPLTELNTIHCWKDPSSDMKYPAHIFIDPNKYTIHSGIGIHQILYNPTGSNALDIVELTKPEYKTMASIDFRTNNPSGWSGSQGVNELWDLYDNHLVVTAFYKSGGVWSSGAKICDLIRHETPANPFYVRWINNYGKWDYWMFQPKATINRTLTANDYYEQNDGLGIQQSYNKEGKDVIEVSTGIQDLDVIKAISLIAFSPVIQVLAGSTWIPLQIDKADSQWMTDEPTSELVMSFLLPTPQINK